MCIIEFLYFFCLAWHRKNSFNDVVGLSKKFQNVAFQPILLNSYRIIAYIVQNACYRYFFEAIRDRDLNFLTMSLVNFKDLSIFLIPKGSDVSFK